MVKYCFIAATLLFLASCHNTKDRSTISSADTLETYEQYPFGTIQPALEKSTPGETIIRIDSLLERNEKAGGGLNVYYRTNRGIREYSRKKSFKTLVTKGYRADGDHSCVGSSTAKNGRINYCFDSACTLVIDSIPLTRTRRPIKQLHPEKEKPCEPCTDKPFRDKISQNSQN